MREGASLCIAAPTNRDVSFVWESSAQVAEGRIQQPFGYRPGARAVVEVATVIVLIPDRDIGQLSAPTLPSLKQRK